MEPVALDPSFLQFVQTADVLHLELFNMQQLPVGGDGVNCLWTVVVCFLGVAERLYFTLFSAHSAKKISN